MEDLDINNLTSEELHLIYMSKLENWDYARLVKEYLTPEYIKIRIRNNKARNGNVEW